MQPNGIRKIKVSRAKRIINAKGFAVQPLLLADVMLVTLRAAAVRPGSDSDLSAAAMLLSLLSEAERCEPR